MIELPWGERTLDVRIPATWRVLGTFVPPTLAPAADAAAACREALAAPIGAPPLASRDLRGKRVLLVSDDTSRPTPVKKFIWPVREALVAAGVAPGDIEILFALGVHRPMTEAEAIDKIGAEAAAAHRWHNHDSNDLKQLEFLGTTARGTPVWLNHLLRKFDLVIPLGAIEPHILLGFSGGYKMLVPGCAGSKTIGHNHLQGTAEREFNYVGIPAENSPMRLDLEEAASKVGREVFVVNAALTPQAEPVRFFCGDPVQAMRTGAQFVRAHTEVVVPEQADVVIANSSPFDADLRQGMKCVGNTFFAARPGGAMLGFVRCTEGRGDLPLPPITLPYNWMQRLIRTIGKQRIMPLVNVMKKFDPIEQKFLAHFGLQMLHRNDISIYSENLQPNVGKKLGIVRQYQQIEQMIAATVERVGREATVAVFPQGGVTYSRGPKLEVA